MIVYICYLFSPRSSVARLEQWVRPGRRVRWLWWRESSVRLGQSRPVRELSWLWSTAAGRGPLKASFGKLCDQQVICKIYIYLSTQLCSV